MWCWLVHHTNVSTFNIPQEHQCVEDDHSRHTQTNYCSIKSQSCCSSLCEECLWWEGGYIYLIISNKCEHIDAIMSNLWKISYVCGNIKTIYQTVGTLKWYIKMWWYYCDSIKCRNVYPKFLYLVDDDEGKMLGIGTL